MVERADGRRAAELRKVRIVPGFIPPAEGSALIELGRTRVICTASVEDGVPSFLRGGAKGWVTAEYGMLPRSTATRRPRDATRGRTDGRSQEIQRLIGRSLRSVIDLGALGERTVWIDCDVIEADGGTRTAAITGAYVALARAMARLVGAGVLTHSPLVGQVAAVSVGIVGRRLLLDLCYEEDRIAEVDCNVVMTDRGRLVEVQGTAEGRPFTPAQLSRMLELAWEGIRKLNAVQREALREPERSAREGR